MRVITAGGTASVPFAITAPSGSSTLSSVQPNSVAAGSTAAVVASGSGLPSNAGAYQVVNSAGTAISGVQVINASGGGSSATLEIQTTGTATPGSYWLQVTFSTGARAAVPFSVTAATPMLQLTGVQPSQIIAGATTMVTAQGSALPLAASNYSVVNSAGTAVAGISITAASGTPSAVTLTIQVAATATAGACYFRVSSGGAVAQATLTIQAAAVGPNITFPAGDAVLAVRYGTRGVSMQRVIAVLSMSPSGFSTLSVFAEGQPGPLFPSLRTSAPNVITDCAFVDLKGNGDMFLAVYTEKDQSNMLSTARFDILNPSTGQSVLAKGAVTLTAQCVNPYPDFGDAVTIRVDRDYLVITPQTSFLYQNYGRVDFPNVYFVRYDDSQNAVTVTSTAVQATNGDDNIERSISRLFERIPAARRCSREPSLWRRT